MRRPNPLLFLGLVAAQAAHSIEECVQGLWVVFPPARFVGETVGGWLDQDVGIGFAAANVGIVAIGIICYAVWVRPGRTGAAIIAGAWALIEVINGVVHTSLAITAGGYFPGVITAPILFVLGIAVAFDLIRR